MLCKYQPVGQMRSWREAPRCLQLALTRMQNVTSSSSQVKSKPGVLLKDGTVAKSPFVHKDISSLPPDGMISL